MKVSIARARELRKNATDAERVLWQHLRLRQIHGSRFRRQRPMGPYIVDFVCLDKKVVIEVDGGQHSDNPQRDKARDEWLQNQGYKILRFWNHEVLTQIDLVKEVIWKTLAEAPSLILPRSRGRNESAIRGSHD